MCIPSVSTYNQHLASNQTKSDGSEPVFEYHVLYVIWNDERGVTYKIPSQAVVSLLLKHMTKIITKLL